MQGKTPQKAKNAMQKLLMAKSDNQEDFFFKWKAASSYCSNQVSLRTNNMTRLVLDKGLHK